MVHRRQRSLECCRTDLVAGGIAVMLWSLVTIARKHHRHLLGAGLHHGQYRADRFSRKPIYLADAITYVDGSQLIHS